MSSHDHLFQLVIIHHWLDQTLNSTLHREQKQKKKTEVRKLKFSMKTKRVYLFIYVSADEGLYLLILKLHCAPLIRTVEYKQYECGLEYSIKIDQLHLDPHRAPWTWFLLSGPGPPPCGADSSLIRPISAISSSDLIRELCAGMCRWRGKNRRGLSTRPGWTQCSGSELRRVRRLESPTSGCRGPAGAQVTDDEEGLFNVGLLTTLFWICLLWTWTNHNSSWNSKTTRI